MNTFRLLAFLLFVQLHGRAQIYSASDFKETPPPKIYSPGWYTLNGGPYEISVAAPGGQLVFSNSRKSNKKEYQLPDGKLIGVDEGEWGGGLYYAPADSTKKEVVVNGNAGPLSNDPFSGVSLVPKRNSLYDLVKGKVLLARGNVKFIFSYQNSVYFIEGIAHLSESVGGLYRLDIGKNSFTVSRVISFDDAPMAMAIHNDTLYIATDSKFYLVTPRLEQQLILKDLFWSGLYPNSMVVADDRHVYVGMRSGYACVDVPAGQLKFYQYKP